MSAPGYQVWFVDHDGMDLPISARLRSEDEAAALIEARYRALEIAPEATELKLFKDGRLVRQCAVYG